MAELQLTRAPGDRALYEFEGVGTLRFTGWASRAGTAQAGTRRWQIGRRGFWRRVIQATDAAGSVVGEFERRSHRGAKPLRWAGHEFALRRDSLWRERYVLIDGDRRLATIEGKSWGRRPVNVTTDDPALIDPGLLLFAAFVVRTLAADTAAAAS